MSKIVSIGDSFASISIDQRSYIQLLAARIGADVYQHSPAVGASSLDHMFMEQWPAAIRALGSGDVLLVSLTNPDRTFFFRDDHMLSMPSCADDGWMSNRPYVSYVWSTDEKEAFKSYYMHLHDDKRNLSWLHSWFYYLDCVCSQVGVRAIVMDCFGGQNGTASIPTSDMRTVIRSIGSLSDISTAEVANDQTSRYLSIHVDPRINHMMLWNHDVMASKIYDALHGAPLDLTTGFRNGCFNISLVNDPVWFSEHIGNGHIDRSWILERISGYA